MNQEISPRIKDCFTRLSNGGEPLALATVIQAVSPTSGKPGDKALISADGIVEGWIGGGCVQGALRSAAKKSLTSQQPCLIRVAPEGEWQAMDGLTDFSSRCLSGGSLLIFIEPLESAPRLSILGDSPIAYTLIAMAPSLGFSTCAVSPDIEPARLPENVGHFSDFSNVTGEFCVIATQGKQDMMALNAALTSNAIHIAMVASAKKTNALRAKLAEQGFNAQQLARIHSPAGLPIYAKTPEEIALSLLAELVKVRRGGIQINADDPPSETGN